MLAARDPRLVWSVICDPNDSDADTDAYLIVPGFWRSAEGWRITAIPWNPAHHVVGYFTCGCDD